MVQTAVDVRKMLKDMDYACSLVNARFVKPIDEEQIREIAKEHKLLVTLEENVEKGGFGESVQSFVNASHLDIKVLTIAIPDMYVEHGNVEVLKKELGIDAECISRRIVTTYVGL